MLVKPALRIFLKLIALLTILISNNNNSANTDHHGYRHAPLLSPLTWGFAGQLAPALRQHSKHCENAAAGGRSVSVTMCNTAAMLACKYHIRYQTGWKLFILLVLSQSRLSTRWLHYYQQNVVVERQVWSVEMTPQCGSPSVTTSAFVNQTINQFCVLSSLGFIAGLCRV